MAFDAAALSILSDSIGGGSIRLFGYETEDTTNTVLGAGYMREAASVGLRESDVVFVSDGDGNADIYRVGFINAAGNATLEVIDSSSGQFTSPTGDDDDTEFLQAKLDALRDNDGGVLWLGPGTFRIQGLVLYPRTRIVGCGWNVTQLLCIENWVDEIPMIGADRNGEDSFSDWGVLNLTLTGPGEQGQSVVDGPGGTTIPMIPGNGDLEGITVDGISLKMYERTSNTNPGGTAVERTGLNAKPAGWTREWGEANEAFRTIAGWVQGCVIEQCRVGIYLARNVYRTRILNNRVQNNATGMFVSLQHPNMVENEFIFNDIGLDGNQFIDWQCVRNVFSLNRIGIDEPLDRSQVEACMFYQNSELGLRLASQSTVHNCLLKGPDGFLPAPVPGNRLIEIRGRTNTVSNCFLFGDNQEAAIEFFSPTIDNGGAGNIVSENFVFINDDGPFVAKRGVGNNQFLMIRGNYVLVQSDGNGTRGMAFWFPSATETKAFARFRVIEATAPASLTALTVDSVDVINPDSVYQITLTSRGSGYTSEPTVSITGGGGAGATARAAVAGPIDSITINSGGVDYNTSAATPPTFRLVETYPHPQRVTGTQPEVTFTIDGSGTITGIDIVDGGAGWIDPVVEIVDYLSGDGTGADIEVTVARTGEVVDVQVTAPGDSYETAPTIGFSGGGGSGAAATATLVASLLDFPTTYQDKLHNIYKMASNIAAAINSHTSTPDWTATAWRDQVFVISALPGSTYDNKAVAATVSGTLTFSPAGAAATTDTFPGDIPNMTMDGNVVRAIAPTGADLTFSEPFVDVRNVSSTATKNSHRFVNNDVVLASNLGGLVTAEGAYFAEANNSIFTGNRFTAGTGHTLNNPLVITSSTGSIVKDNIGYKTENYGTATVANATTEISVAHGLAATPARVAVWPTNNLGTAAKFWVPAADIGATNFKIKVDADPGAGTATFGWLASVLTG